jgi:hypothetical protein
MALLSTQISNKEDGGSPLILRHADRSRPRPRATETVIETR